MDPYPEPPGDAIATTLIAILVLTASVFSIVFLRGC